MTNVVVVVLLLVDSWYRAIEVVTVCGNGNNGYALAWGETG